MAQTTVLVQVRRATDRVNVIDISGQITAAAEAALADAYAEASSGVRAVILNFADMEYMNSSGIGLLVTLLIRAQRQAQRLLAVGLSEHYREIFDLTRLNEAIQIFVTESEAIAAA